MLYVWNTHKSHKVYCTVHNLWVKFTWQDWPLLDICEGGGGDVLAQEKWVYEVKNI